MFERAVGGGGLDRGVLADGAETLQRGAFGVGAPCREPEPGVHDPALALDRWHRLVQRARQVHGDVTGTRGQRDRRQVGAALVVQRRPHERAVRTRHHAQLTRDRVGAADRDADGHAAAVVAVTTQRAVLVPRQVGDALHHVERLEEGLDAVAFHGPVHVVIAGEVGEPLQPLVGDELLDRGRHLVEVLHAHEQVVAAAVARPPRPAVAARVRRCGGVHVARHRGHLVLGEHTLEVEVTRALEEVAHLLERRVGGEAAVEGERRAIGVDQVDRTLRVRRTTVERTAQQQPPVEERVEAPHGLVERAVGLHADHGHLVVDQVLELRAVRAQHRRRVVVAAGDDAHHTVVDRERPRVTVDVDRQRSRLVLRHRGREQVLPAFERGRQHLFEAGCRIDRLDLTVDAGAFVDRHAVLPRSINVE